MNIADGDYVTLAVWGDVTVEAGGLLTAEGQGFPGQQGPGAGVAKGEHGSGGKYIIC